MFLVRANPARSTFMPQSLEAITVALFVLSVVAAFLCGTIMALVLERKSLLRNNARLELRLADKSKQLDAVLCAYAPPVVAAVFGAEDALQTQEQRETEAAVARRETEAIMSAGV